METVATFYDNLTILQNSTIPNSSWESEIRSLFPTYTPSLQWPGNKTIIHGYRTPTACIFPLDVFLKEAVIIVPISLPICSLLPSLIAYITCTIKSICPVPVANEMGFRLTLYVPQHHVDVSNLNHDPLFFRYTLSYIKGVLNEPLESHMHRYEMVFKFDNNWNIISTNRMYFNPSLGMFCSSA